MGICKCKKRTDFFCFIHKKAVCEHCICTEHQVCVVKSYLDWLTDPEYEKAVCGICKGDLQEDNLARFLCLDMFHPECIDVYASSLPPNTAQGGYVCPTCSKPMLPTLSNMSEIADHIRHVFAQSSWATRFLQANDSNGSALEKSDSESIHEDASLSSEPNNLTTTAESSLHPSLAPASLSFTSTSNNTSNTSSNTPNNSSQINPYANTSGQSQPLSSNTTIYGVASRKPQSRLSTLYPLDDEDEDKYKKKGIMQLFIALGLVSKPSGNESKKGIRLDPRRAVLVFGLLACVAIVWMLYLLVLNTDPLTTTQEE